MTFALTFQSMISRIWKDPLAVIGVDPILVNSPPAQWQKRFTFWKKDPLLTKSVPPQNRGSNYRGFGVHRPLVLLWTLNMLFLINEWVQNCTVLYIYNKLLLWTQRFEGPPLPLPQKKSWLRACAQPVSHIGYQVQIALYLNPSNQDFITFS